MATSESKGRFFYKTNRFESIRITNRIESIRIANCDALASRHDGRTDGQKDGRALVASPALREGGLLPQVSQVAWCVCWAHVSFLWLLCLMVLIFFTVARRLLSCIWRPRWGWPRWIFPKILGWLTDWMSSLWHLTNRRWNYNACI